MINVIDRRLQAETTPPETAQKVDRSSRNALLNRARSAAEKGDYAHARELLVDLLMENPDDREAKTLLSRLELADAKARSKEHEREIETADAAKTAEEEKQLKELRKLVADREFEKAAKKADKLLKERPHWPEVETIQTLALHTIEADKERWLDLKGDLLDHQALRELEEASIPPKDPGTIPRPEVVVHKTPLQLESIQQRLQQKVSVNLVEADLSYVLDLLFRATGINIVANPAMLQGQQITIHVEQMPLQELLSYISRNYNILFSATSSAVWVSTPDQPFLETQIRQLTKGLTDVQEQVESTSSDVEKLMERVPELIDWPAGSSYYLDRKRNVLFLRSTPEALSKVNELINEIDNDPLQILIETRFVELQADYFKDFDLDYWLTDKFAVVKEDGAAKIQIDANTGVRWSKLANPLGHLQDGLTGAVSGVLTNPQFEVAIKLLEESNKAKTLSAPRILALNNYTSEIEITKDLIYIEDYEVDRADISGSTVGGTGTTGAAGNSTLSSEPVIIPQFSTGEETGFLLRVTPSVGADHRLITLVLEPEISEEVERMSFNLVIPDYEGDAPIERPIVSRRKLTTKATVADGHVLVLAGLMTSQKSKRESKIPVLGNIPLIGRLFRSDSEVDSKTNLLIFVKATILDGEGRRYHDAGREGAEAGEVGALREDDEFDFATRPE
jgi:type II secretory pathway component GspD/PulD (secretin)